MTDTPDRLETGDLVLDASTCTCRRQANGQLDIASPQATLNDVYMIPTFPLSRRLRMVAVLGNDGKEIAMLDNAAKLPTASRSVVQDELERSYFMPRIIDIEGGEEQLNVLSFDVDTNRGRRSIQIRNARRSFRKLPNNRVVIRDVDGNRYEIQDWAQLPAYSRDLIGQYL